MTTADILTMLKANLEISIDSTTTQGQKVEGLLSNYIQLSKDAIAREGITLPSAEESYTTEDGMLVMLYADYLYRKRAEVLKAMPRQLRYMLNNRLLSEKARATE